MKKAQKKHPKPVTTLLTGSFLPGIIALLKQVPSALASSMQCDLPKGSVVYFYENLWSTVFSMITKDNAEGLMAACGGFCKCLDDDGLRYFTPDFVVQSQPCPGWSTPLQGFFSNFTAITETGASNDQFAEFLQCATNYFKPVCESTSLMAFLPFEAALSLTVLACCCCVGLGVRFGVPLGILEKMTRRFNSAETAHHDKGLSQTEERTKFIP